MPTFTVSKKKLGVWSASALVGFMALSFTVCSKFKALPVMESTFQPHVEKFENHEAEFKSFEKKTDDFQAQQSRATHKILHAVGVPEDEIIELQEGTSEGHE